MQVFSKNYIRISIRVFALGIALTLSCFYLGLFYISDMEFHRFPGFEESANIASKVYLYLNGVIYRSGLPPMISAIYFLVLCRAPQSSLWGLLIVGLSVFPVHIFVFHGMSDSYLQNTVLQLIQLLITFYPIIYWKKKGLDEKFIKGLENSAQKV